jgi:antimicrobial peptide system SdpB family protein
MINFKNNIYTNIYGISRSLLALGLLITLLFNPIEMLFSEELIEISRNKVFLYDLNLFNLFGFKYLFWAKLIACLILILVILGVYPIFTGVLHWWVSYSFFTGSLIVEGGDQVMSILTFLLIPITLLDKRKNHWNSSVSQSNFSLYIGYIFIIFIKIQASVLYLQAGIDKIYKTIEWKNGTAIYYWFNDEIFGMPDFMLGVVNTILSHSVVIFLLNWFVIVFEILMSYMIIAPQKIKSLFFKGAVFFHFCIVIFHGLPTFFLSMVSILILYLLPLDENIKLKNYTKKIFSFRRI